MSSPVDINIEGLSTDAVKVRVDDSTTGAILSRYDAENAELHTVIDKSQNVNANTLTAELVTAPKTTPSAHSTTSNPTSGDFTPILNSDNYVVNTTNSLTLRKPVGGTHGETIHVTLKNTSASNITITIGTDYIVADAIKTIVLATNQWVDITMRYVIDTWMIVGRQTSVASTTNANPFTWRSAYAGGTTYIPNDVVSYLGSSYINILQSTGNVPTNTTYWNLVASVGSTGNTGTTGASGVNAGLRYTYSDAVNLSNGPATGSLMFNSLTFSSITAMNINTTTYVSQAIAAEIDSWDDSTSVINGTLLVYLNSNVAKFAIFRVGAVTDPQTSNYRQVALTHVASSGPFNDTFGNLTVLFFRNGDAGP